MEEYQAIQQAGAGFWDMLPAIITAIGTILTGWFGYNQYTKNKMTDQKIEQWKKEEKEKSAKRSEDLAKIYGELWQLLHGLSADRVYILQPHPLSSNLYLSISLEVKENGISPMKHNIRRMLISDIPAFAADLASRDFMYYKDVSSEIKDDKMRSIFLTNGTDMVVIRKLSDERYDWIGSIVVEHARPVDTPPMVYRALMASAADNIRFILPEYK